MPHQAAYLAARRGPACVRNVCIHVCGLRTLFDGIRSSPLLFSIRKVIIIDASYIRRNALVVQWIGQRFPVPPMQVRFLSEAPTWKPPLMGGFLFAGISWIYISVKNRLNNARIYTVMYPFSNKFNTKSQRLYSYYFAKHCMKMFGLFCCCHITGIRTINIVWNCTRQHLGETQRM